MKRIIFILFVFAFLFSACSGKEKQKTEENTAEDVVQETAEHPVQKDIVEENKIDWTAIEGQKRKKDLAFVLENFCGEYAYLETEDSFNRYGDVKIEYLENSEFCIPEVKDSVNRNNGLCFSLDEALCASRGDDICYNAVDGKMGGTEYFFYFSCDKLVFKQRSRGIFNFDFETGEGEPYDDITEQFYPRKVANNYNNKNGTIIECNMPNMNKNLEYTLRVHNQSMEVSDGSHLKDLNLYAEPSTQSEKIGEISGSVDVQKFLTIQNKKNPREIHIWLFVQCNDKEGFLNVFNSNPDDFDKDAFLLNPYLGDKWACIEKISSGGKDWTVRKMTQTVTIQENLNVRDKPGVDGQKIGFLEKTSDLEKDTYVVVVATEEKEEIDGISDRWLKVQFEEDKEGWIFGGYVVNDIEKIKYHAADDVVEYYFSKEE